VSCAESSTVVLYVMHMRSLTASVEPNAQQEPQSDWSRAPEMRLAHWGHAVDELKLSGMAPTFGATHGSADMRARM
jgi:hypothetical protein